MNFKKYSKIFSASAIITICFFLPHVAKADSLCKCSESEAGYPRMPEGTCIDFCCGDGRGTYYWWGADSSSVTRGDCEGRIITSIGEGILCDSDTTCPAGTKCLPSLVPEMSGDTVCFPLIGKREACTADQYCQTGLKCFNGECTTPCSSASDDEMCRSEGYGSCHESEGFCARGAVIRQTFTPEPVSTSTTGPVSWTSPIGTKTPAQIIGKVIKTALGIIGAIALLMFVYGGIMWMASGGSPERIKKAQTTLVWAVIGLTVIFASYTLVDFIINRF